METVVGLMAAVKTTAEILGLHPHLEEEDVRQALARAEWRAEEIELPLTRG
jgi:uncharacterized protein (DUF433 family)